MTAPMYCPICGTQSAAGASSCLRCGASLRGASGPNEPAAACLRTSSGEAVPLLGVALGGEVFGAHARVVLRQRYKNREGKPVEAVYTFPIPSDATLTGFAMECEGRRIEAEVKEREEAFATYDEAVSKGHGAALLEQERPNIFTASVGNLLPGEETIVEVSFLQKLTADEGALRLMIPTLVAPRYMPGAPAGDRTGHGAADPTSAVPDADRVSPKIGQVSYGLSMDVVFDLGRAVTIESPSHKIQARDEGGHRTRVTFTSREVALDRDIVLVAEGAPDVSAGLVCDRREGEEGTFALTIVPDLFEARKRARGRGVVFVVDVSGSMAGDSIDQAKRALRLCLRHLSEGDQFDILPFSSGFSHFSHQVGGARQQGSPLVRFTQTTLQQADQYVDALEADGGTEMLAPLSAAAQLLSGVKNDRVIVLLTDGQVGNEQQIVDAISKQASGARLYTFGIGTNVSDYLLRELAKRTKGAAEFIHPGERIDEKVTAQFARATAARVSGVSLKWVGVDAGEVAPGDAPALVDGEPWSVYGRYETPGLGRVEIRGALGAEPFFMEVSVDLAARADRPALTSLWAGERVRDLEAVDASALGRRAEAHKKRIIDLCVKHKIASKHTSFVVVEKRTGDRRAQGQPETRAVPVNAPAGWAMFGASQGEGGSLSASSMTMTRAGTVSPQRVAMANAMMKKRASAPGAPPPPMMRSAAYAPPPAPPAMGAPPPLSGFAPQAPPPPGAAYGAPPPMPSSALKESLASPMSPAPMSPAPMPAAKPAAPAKAKGGFFERAKRAIGLSKDEAPPPPAESYASRSAPAPAPEPIEVDRMVAAAEAEEAAPVVAHGARDIGAMFARQLASGLWEQGDTSDRGRLVTTTDRLVECVRAGIDSSHPVYGAQVSKAVEALSALAESLAQKSEAEVIRALLAMAAVSTGKRARGRLVVIAQSAPAPALHALAADLSSQEAARKRLG